MSRRINMDNTVFTLIGSLGFPIVMCLLLYKQQNDTAKMHQEEVQNMQEAINNNTLVVQKLIDKIDEEFTNE